MTQIIPHYATSLMVGFLTRIRVRLVKPGVRPSILRFAILDDLVIKI